MGIAKRSGDSHLQVVVQLVAVAAVPVDVKVQDAGDPGELAAPRARHDLVVQRLRSAVHRSELVPREAAFLLAEAAAHRLDCDVVSGAGLWITDGSMTPVPVP